MKCDLFCKGFETKDVFEQLKSKLKLHLVNQEEYKSSLTFALYTILSQTYQDDELYLIRTLIKHYEDSSLELQQYLYQSSDLKYCIAEYLSDIYINASKDSVSELLAEENKMLEFCFLNSFLDCQELLFNLIPQIFEN